MEDLIYAQQLGVHARRIVPYPVKKWSEHASEDLRQQAAHFETVYHLVEEIEGLRKWKGSYEVLVQ